MNGVFSNPGNLPDKHLKVDTWYLSAGKEVIYKLHCDLFRENAFFVFNPYPANVENMVSC